MSMMMNGVGVWEVKVEKPCNTRLYSSLPREVVMNPSSAILICDRDQPFCEALRNFLLAAGYAQVEVVATAREAMAKWRRQLYGHIFIGAARPFSKAWRLAVIAQHRQPEAKIFLLLNAKDIVIFPADSSNYIIKEHAFESLLNLLKDQK